MILFFNISFAEINPEKALSDSAKISYDKGDYSSAKTFYNQLEKLYPKNFEICYNLGNINYRLGNRGWAVYYYEKALLIKPGDKDAIHNLSLLNIQLTDKFDAIPQFNLFPFFNSLNSVLSYNFLAISSVIVLILLAFIFFKYKQKKIRLSFFNSWFLILLSVFLFIWSYLQHIYIKNHKEAVIIVFETKVMSEPNPNSNLIYKLHEGTKLKVLESNSSWLKVQMPDKNQAWIVKSDLAILNMNID